MDRLAEIPRSTQAQRPDANDFTRPKSARNDRTERRDEVEPRSEDKVKERERPERPSERTERFSLHLEEQKASLAPQEALAAAPAADAQETGEVEETAGEARVEGKPGQSSAPKGTAIDVDGGLESTLEAVTLDIPAAVAGEAKPEQPPAQGPVVPQPILPTAAPVLFVEAQTAETANANELEPAIASAPRIDVEQKTLDVELAAAKPDVARSEAPASTGASSGTRTELPIEAPKPEAARETTFARSAHEVERAADILRQIRVQITPQMNEARIQLHPIELGRISIHLSVENGRVKTIVNAEKPETLQAIQTHLPELRASLRQHGIDAQEFQLSLGFENNGGRDADRAQRRPNARTDAAAVATIERSPALHAALAKTGVDFYA